MNHPDAYIEEPASGPPVIAGVETSIAGFAGAFAQGPVHEAVRVASTAEFEAAFGGLRPDSLASYAIPQFFLNGGGEAYVVRTPDDAPAAEALSAALPAFDAVDLLNVLCLPDTDRLPDAAAAEVMAAATAYAARRRAFYIADPPNLEVTRDETAKIQTWLEDHAGLRHPNVAAYFPRPMIADSLDEFRLRATPASGVIAGLFARTDSEHGVWKAPAGRHAVLRGIQGLERVLTNAQHDVLNALGLNGLRYIHPAGNLCWGARTLAGADAPASDWKYIPVRRLLLFLEESIDRGTRFAVFEPNDEVLWSRLRHSVALFMEGLFRKGAFQGQKADEAYFVKCGRETTTPEDVQRGLVHIAVGFAPMRPAEFVMIRIQQQAGQTQA